ncbi:Lysine acetyltransferase [Smittium culicis]|uniref:Lysine acetyltransferase n=1 Tax=Smittium culicis TaxID=133412 RepID=A0A1R1Y182_9FUNG|nr:Lysine acetyltransferase [Smittium culicis]OMJ20466.1 Lysine acetyltransferase [Smittium culicis]
MSEHRIDLSEFVLVKASTRDQILKTREASFQEWGRDIMDIETWQKRESLLESLDFIKENLITWIFGKKADLINPDETCSDSLEFFSQFETIKRPAFVKRCGSAQVEIVDSLNIPVYTCTNEHRGKGYGKRMLELAQKEMSKLSKVSMLHSDVGENFYGRCGWDAYKLISTIIPVDKNYNQENMNSTSTEAYFFDKEFASILAKADSNVLLKEMQRSPITDSTLVSVVPEFTHYEWRNVRDNFEAKNCLNVTKVPVFYGAIVNNGNISPLILKSKLEQTASDTKQDISCPSFIIWTHRFKENSILVLRTRINSSDDVVPLVKAALKEAKDFNLSKVEFWNFYPEYTDKLIQNFNVNSKLMKKSIPCLSLFDKTSDEKVEWLLNEQVSFV